MTNKQRYRKFCESEKDIPIFSKDWWLDVVCGEESWDVVLVEIDGQIVASMPYYKKKIQIFDIITMPKLTQTMGPYIKYPSNQKYVSKLGYEKKIMNALIDQLPRFDYFMQNFHYSITNWLPFYWRGFSQTTRYTYVIEDLSNLDKIFRDFDQDQRATIRKAEKIVKVISSEDIELFYKIGSMTFKRQGIETPYTLNFLKRLDNACSVNNCRKIFFAKDERERVHAAIYIVWDKNSAYLLMTGGDPHLRNSGAESLLIWEAIKFSSTVTKKFDFEGSMIESIEMFFRSFGGIQKPYFSIKRVNSKILEVLLCMRRMIR